MLIGRSLGSSVAARSAGPAPRSTCDLRHQRTARPMPSVPSGAVSLAAAAGTSSPTSGPRSPPAMIPIAGLGHQRDDDADDRRPTIAATTRAGR